MVQSFNDLYLLALRQITNISDKTIPDLEQAAFNILGLPFPYHLNYPARLALLQEYSLDLIVYDRFISAIEDRTGSILLIRDLS
jgi:hypothetical protein